jgi:uncharacterized membrane protein
MSDTTLRMQNRTGEYINQPTNWAAIWGGVFTFAAIWIVFEALAMAIFPGRGTNVGLEIWTVVLTIIAMYVAGVATGRMAGVASTHEGLMHGMMMFGLSVVSAIVLTTLATGVVVGATGAHSAYAIGFAPGTEWAGFFALFLGWLAAMGGASSGVARRTVEVRQTVEPPIQMRPAA